MDAKMVKGNLAQFKKCIEKVYYFVNLQQQKRERTRGVF